MTDLRSVYPLLTHLQSLFMNPRSPTGVVAFGDSTNNRMTHETSF